MELQRGEIYRVRHPARGGAHGEPKRSRCFVVVSRQELLDSQVTRVLCAPVNSAGAGLATEVTVGVAEGLKHASVVNCDQITRLERAVLTDYVGVLPTVKIKELRTALRTALDID